MQCKAGEHLHCHIYGKGCEGTGNTYYYVIVDTPPLGSVAAKELVTRITNEFASRNITANINEMYIGTFHSLCLRILKEHLEYTRLRRNYRLMDSFDQQYMVFQNIHRFRSIPEIEIVLPNGGSKLKRSATL